MINYVLEKSSMFPKKVVDLAEKAYNDTKNKNIMDIATKEGFGIKEDIKTKGGELKGLPDYEHLKWGSFTKQFKAFKSSHPRVNSLEKFAEYIIRHKDKFHRKTLKRAYFYIDIIKKGDGIEINSDSSSDSSDSSSDSECENIILPNNIMPRHPKGSQEAKDYMAKIRAMKGKGLKGSPSKTHVGEEDYTTKKGDKYHHRKHHLVNTGKLPYTTGGEISLPIGYQANRLAVATYLPRNYNDNLIPEGLSTTTMMNVPMSRTAKVVNAGSIRPPPMGNSSKQNYLGEVGDSYLGASGNMSYKSLMSL